MSIVWVNVIRNISETWLCLLHNLPLIKVYRLNSRNGIEYGSKEKRKHILNHFLQPVLLGYSSTLWGFFFTIQFIAEKFVHTEYVILVLNCVPDRYHPPPPPYLWCSGGLNECRWCVRSTAELMGWVPTSLCVAVKPFCNIRQCTCCRLRVSIFAESTTG